MVGNKNSALNAAKAARQDEFYTQLTDIEKEIKNYRRHFKGKTVLCNCDDPRVSNFWRFFSENFEFLGLKKLIATCYKSRDTDLFSQHGSEQAIAQVYEGDKNGNMMVDPDEIKIINLKGDGDFRSEECLRFLEEADIVVTNPPFSLAREFIALMMKMKKKFLVIGNLNMISCKEIFPLIKDGKMWLGASIHSGDREFEVPKDYPLDASGCHEDPDGRRYIRVKGVRWFTNLDYKERHDELPLCRHYNQKEYPKYDDYDAINVDKTCDIPCDYDGVIGVPISFIDKFCPDQFDILGIDRYIADNPHPGKRFSLKGKEVYARVLIRRKKGVNE